jgi:SAM-dependent methyltransferase
MPSPSPAPNANDELHRRHPGDAYYASAPWPIRLVEARRIAIIRAMLGDVTGLDLVEVGCGSGHVLQHFAGARLTAIDPSGEALEAARRNLRGLEVRFRRGAVEELDLGGERFDRVLCTEVLEHTADPEIVLGALTRLVRPNGVVVVTVPNDPLIAQFRRFARLLPGKFDWGGADFHLHRWTPQEFEAMLARHLTVVARDAAPLRVLPLRACFRCRPHGTRR